MAATSMGASHLVLSPRAGMLYGSALLWLVLIVHVLKYPAFEHGPRYALATGRSLVEGYSRVPGPRNWAVWCFVVFTAIQGVAVAVAVTSVAASALRVAVGGLSLSQWGAILATVVLGLLWLGRFPAMEAANKVMMIVLGVVTVTTFLSSPPKVDAWLDMFNPSLPPGSVVLAAAIVGWLPTGLDVSVWHSLWALEVESRWEDEPLEPEELVEAEIKAEAKQDKGGIDGLDEDISEKRINAQSFGGGRLRRLRRGLLDMRVGYGASLLLAVLFMFLGSQVPDVMGREAEGAEVALSISKAYSHILGSWIVPVFMTAAFVGMFATAYIVMDGFPRAFAEGLRVALHTRGGGDKKRLSQLFYSRIYWGALIFVWAMTCLIHFAWPRPVFLAIVGALLGLGVSPLYYVLNHYCVKKHIKEAQYKPNRWVMGVSAAGILFVAGALFLWGFTQVFKSA